MQPSMRLVLACLGLGACAGDDGGGSGLPDDLDVIASGPASGTIEAITATTVTGGLHVFNSEFGEVNGRFDGTLCFSNP